jgi:hypothetical protein
VIQSGTRVIYTGSYMAIILMRRQNSPQKPFKFPIHYVWVHVVILNYAFCLNRFICVVCYFNSGSITWASVNKDYIQINSMPLLFELCGLYGAIHKYDISSVIYTFNCRAPLSRSWVRLGYFFFYWITFITT